MNAFKLPQIEISGKENLIMKIFVIGYPVWGESIVILFIDTTYNFVIYSCVIDSFTHDNYNMTIDILKRYNVKALNILCWSHPDKDHSYGLSSIIDSFCNLSTIFLVPQGVYFKKHEKIRYNKKETGEIFKGINDINNLTKGSFVSVGTAPFCRNEIASFVFSDYPDYIPIEIDTLAPPSPLLNYRIMNSQKIKKNELSIFLRITVDEHKFLFCSDVENDAIGDLNPLHLSNPILLKIPHHGSDTSDRLLDVVDFSSGCTYSCVTKYRDKLPYRHIISDYLTRCTMVHYTGSNCHHNYGCIEYTFTPYNIDDSGNHISSMAIDCHGNAARLTGPENLYQKPK